ncbi:MAG: zinc-binding dehydrogenase, partial [Gammaproteobacteria bacterium]|nr:zinc-binding dehydrogenase [Gammaproteobacteria bacterium]
MQTIIQPRLFTGWAFLCRDQGKLEKEIYSVDFPISTSLGVLGMAAWGSVNKVLEIEPGNTIVISGASGSVGTLVGQLAKLKGVGNVVGICGSYEKIEHLKRLGFDNGINYKKANDFDKMSAAL